jgi:2-keto-3-deoxy-L-rhamnonate aldolase RhmA
MLTEIQSPEILRALAVAGMDFIDTEHPAYEVSSITDMTRAGTSSDLSCYVRVTEGEYFLMARALDIGAHGVMVPRVETKEQVERVVAAAKYSPKGRRGHGVRSIITRFESCAVSDWVDKLNDDSVIIIQLESKRAIDTQDTH